MQTPGPASSPNPTSSLTIPRLLLLLALTVAATAAVVYFVVRPGPSSSEAVVSVLAAPEAQALRINTLETIDATGRTDVQPEVGRRYRVRIDSESREGASCIAHIGRMITFVDGVKPGQVVVVEVTRLKKTTAEAVVVQAAEPAEGGLLVPAAAAETSAPAGAVAPAAPGPIYTGVVFAVGKFGDGILKADGNTVYVGGVQKGDRITFEVTEKRDRGWTGRLVAKLGTGPAEGAAVAPAAPRTDAPRRDLSAADHVQPGKEYEVTITDRERTHPDQDGMVRIDGLVVIVPGTQPGARVKIRITERRPTLAKADVLERLPVAPAQ